MKSRVIVINAAINVDFLIDFNVCFQKQNDSLVSQNKSVSLASEYVLQLKSLIIKLL